MKFSPESKPSVLLSHSGVQHSYWMASALQEARLLNTFWTTFYGFKGRRYEGLRNGVIHSMPWPEILHKVATLLLGKNYITTNELLYHRNCWFDHHVAGQLDRASFDCFIGNAGSCLKSLKKTKELGRLVLIDQHDIHPNAALRLLKEEIDLHPDFTPLISYWPPHQGYLERVLEELELADQILVPSRFSLYSHTEAGIPREKLALLPYGTDLRPSLEAPQKRKKPFTILFVGTLTQRKGIKYLLEAVKQLRLPDCELILIGKIDGSPKPLRPYQDFFRHLGFLDREALKTYWALSDVLVLPSIYDSFGLVILEAMAHGLPVIVSENTAAKDVVREGIDGFVVPIRDIEALKDRILHLYEDPNLVREMGLNARARAQEFTWIKYRERLASFLKMIYKFV